MKKFIEIIATEKIFHGADYIYFFVLTTMVFMFPYLQIYSTLHAIFLTVSFATIYLLARFFSGYTAHYKIPVFILIFTTAPILLFSILANDANLTQRIAGKLHFVDGNIAGYGLYIWVMIFGSIAVIIVLLKFLIKLIAKQTLNQFQLTSQNRQD